MPHTHLWRRLYEEFLLGGAFPVGWECECGEFISNDKLTPEGLPGKTSEIVMRLVGPHGGMGRTSNGASYRGFGRFKNSEE